MKFAIILTLILFLFCTGQKKEASVFHESDIRPHELYATFSSAETKLLHKNGFFARTSPYLKYSALYKALEKSSMPIYVTTDCVLHTYHILYDYSLRILEVDYLYEQINDLTEKMIAGTQELLQEDKGYMEDVLLDNLAYFEVAAKLMNPDFTVSPSVEKKVNAEIRLIDKAEGFDKSPLFGYKEDYSQYEPRGHYTRNDALRRYFRAMMWYGRMAFRLKPEKDIDNRKGKEETKRALLILDVVKKHFEAWKRINAPINLYVGKSDDLTILEYDEINNSIFPGEIEPMEIAQDNEKLTKFIDEALDYRPPRIVSTAVPDTERPELTTKGLKFFGQKFIPDSYIFQNLVYDKVGTQEDPRLFPRGLDVLAVLESARAQELLIQRYRENRFIHYEDQREKLIEEFKNIKEDDWFVNLYWGWLFTLKSLLVPVPGFQPAYQDKCLQTALGSWAELRHDTILYAKQSYTAEITAIPPEPKMVKGYVEPIPECFLRLKKLVDMSSTKLEEQAILNKTVKQKFEQFSRVLSDLHRIAELEVAHKQLTNDDYRFIQRIGDVLEGLESFPGADYITETDESSALIADVHTDPNTQQVLEAGNDVPAMFYTVVSINGEAQIFVGGIYDYYEFLYPVENRLTDEKWQKLSPKPDKPEWIEFFVR